MPQTATPSPASPSFAGLLAALAAPAQNSAPAWNDDELADDVATLSYERALRAHSRYQNVAPADLTDRALLESAEPASNQGEKEFSAVGSPVRPAATPPDLRYSSTDVHTKGDSSLPAALGSDLKSASITIRLSKLESAQLRQRAAEAGLTISAYLRSCTFEAESLRTLVKDTLAQLRASPSSPDRSNAMKIVLNPGRRSGLRSSWLEWLRAILPRWHSRQTAARA